MAGCAGEQLLTTHTAVQIRRTEINNDTFVFSLAVAEVSGEAYNYYHHTHRVQFQTVVDRLHSRCIFH
jgi:hypothetical protein